jgi:hypothetical protein
MVQYIEKDNIFEEIDSGKYDYSLVSADCYCHFPNGYGRKVRLYYDYVFKKEMQTKYGDLNKLGTLFAVNGQKSQNFIILYIMKGYNFRPDKEKDYFEYDAFKKCMKKINIEYSGKKIICPLFGINKFDGNGDKEKIKQIIESNCDRINLTVYDYKQKTREEELKEEIEKLRKLKEENYDEYKKRIAERKLKAKKLKEKNGMAGY